MANFKAPRHVSYLDELPPQRHRQGAEVPAEALNELLHVESVEVHHLGPGYDEVVDEFPGAVIRGIDFRNGTQLGV